MPITSRDYYEVLGVSRDADEKAIKDAFRTLALRYHPDRNKEPDAEERFKEIAEAYAVLSDPTKRAAYDAGGVAGVSPEDLCKGINFEALFGGLGFDFDVGAGGFLDRFFRRRPRGPAGGDNFEVDIDVPLERVCTGGEETGHLTHPQTCPACHGSRAKAGTTQRPCEACKGTGQQVTSRRDSGIVFQQITTCPTCQGRGAIIDQPCPECSGRGAVDREETVTVNVPVGVEEGMALRLPGRGMPSPEAGGVPGDLFIVVHSTPDRRFERRGADLWRPETVQAVDATLGTTLEVPTLDGTVSVTIPPGAQPDTVLRVHGKGLPRFGDGRRGDLYLRVQVHIPAHLSPEERTLYERLRTLSAGHQPRRR